MVEIAGIGSDDSEWNPGLRSRIGNQVEIVTSGYGGIKKSELVLALLDVHVRPWLSVDSVHISKQAISLILWGKQFSGAEKLLGSKHQWNVVIAGWKP